MMHFYSGVLTYFYSGVDTMQVIGRQVSLTAAVRAVGSASPTPTPTRAFSGHTVTARSVGPMISRFASCERRIFKLKPSFAQVKEGLTEPSL
jgi:hypothetical protein